jgi:CO dehydrogenase maturation factor
LLKAVIFFAQKEEKMRLAVSGKGGVGKTTIAGTLCRLIGRFHHPVLALDADSNPNLAICLGLPQESSGQLTAVPTNLGEWRTDENDRAYVHITIPIPQLKEQYGISAPDNVTLLTMGNVDHAGVGCRCSAHAPARGIMGHFWQDEESVIVTDMEAGLEHMGRGTTEHADALLIVVEPYYRALEAGQRIQKLALDLGIPRIYAVANKIRTAEDQTAVKCYCERYDLPVLASVPYDEQLITAERNGRTILDTNPDNPFVQAINQLATRLYLEVNNASYTVTRRI